MQINRLKKLVLPLEIVKLPAGLRRQSDVHIIHPEDISSS
jgi:hypothetical protein